MRSATHPFASDEAGAAPFAAGPWLFSHNGRHSTTSRALRRSCVRRAEREFAAAGLRAAAWWTDVAGDFALSLAVAG